MLSQFDNATVYGRLRVTCEPDPGLPCRLLDLFAARGVLPLAVDLRQDPRHAHLTLRVDALMGAHDWAILCAKAAQAVGVLQLEQDTAVVVADAA